jgi:predicted transcriptional regulator
MKPDRTFIISVRPQWAHLFFDSDNRKSVELRKAGFGRLLIPGDTIVIYATLPVGAAIGTVVVSRCECKKTPETLWRSTNQGHLAKVTRSEFDTYYRDAKAAMAIWVKEPELFERPIPLAELRSNWGCWQPPQQIQKLSPKQVADLSEIEYPPLTVCPRCEGCGCDYCDFDGFYDPNDKDPDGTN